MSMYTLPKEMYKKILFNTDPKTLMIKCGTDKYATTICDETFFKEYIKLNYNSKDFGIESWTDKNIDDEIKSKGFDNWKQLLRLIDYGLKKDVSVQDMRGGKLYFKLSISYNNSIGDIENAIINVIRHRLHINKHILHIEIFGQVTEEDFFDIRLDEGGIYEYNIHQSISNERGIDSSEQLITIDTYGDKIFYKDFTIGIEFWE